MSKPIEDVRLRIASGANFSPEYDIELWPLDKKEVFMRVTHQGDKHKSESLVLLPIQMLQQISVRMPNFLANIAEATEDGDESRVPA